MGEFLSPGVFLEEVPAQFNATLAVSTSTCGALGYTQRGPADEATLVTSLEQFQKKFGSQVTESLLSLAMMAFFTNGGRRAYVTRVVPADAVAANCRFQNAYVDQQLELSNGTDVTFTKTAATTLLKAANGAAPLKPGTFSLRYRKAGAAKTKVPAVARDGTTALVAVTAQASYEGRIDPRWSAVLAGAASPDGDVRYTAVASGPSAVTVTHVDPGTTGSLSVAVVGNDITVTLAYALSAVTSTAADVAVAVLSAAPTLVVAAAQGTGLGLTQGVTATSLTGLPAYDEELDSAIRGTVTVYWPATTERSLAFTVGTSSVVTVTGGTGTDGATGTLDTRTGTFSIRAYGTWVPVIGDNGDPLTATYTPALATMTVVDNGSGVLTGTDVSSGTIAYTTGAYTLTLTTAPHNKARMLAAYTNNAWSLTPISKGTWGDGLRMQVEGHADWYSVATASYSRFNVWVRMYNSSTLTYDVVEQFEEIDFSDETAVQYFADVINEMSDYVRVAEPGSLYTPEALNGREKSIIIAGGDGLAPGQTIQTTFASVPIGPRSVVISWTDTTGIARTITDNGSGALIGHIDGSGVNTIDYTTGDLDVKLGYAIRGGTVVTAIFYTTPSSTYVETFGDTTKQYTYGGVTYYLAGDNGTFDSTNWGRAQFTSPGLVASKAGLYSFETVEEILQVIVPDFAGDVTITGDLLDYAAMRAALPHGGDRFIVLTTPIGCNPQEAVDWFRYDLGRFSDFAALYWPWVKITDPLTNRPKLVPPLGHVAGIYARCDSTRNVAKAPAGTVDGLLNFLIGLEYISSHGERDLLYPNKINALVSGTNTGLAVWGARTISSQSQWRYVPVRRLFMFLEKSVFNSTFWAVFEPNGPGLWSKVSMQISSFLLGLFNQTYFAGSSPSKAFFVICDSSNNDNASIEAGQMICDIGVAPLKPAEYIRFRFAQKTL